ncbi:MAG: hypothetical protein R3B49_00155 [Phycisphaerales bacterium]
MKAERARARSQGRGGRDPQARYEAEAKGVQQVLEAKAEGYRSSQACADNPQVAHAAADRAAARARPRAGQGDQQPQDRQDHVWDSGSGGGKGARNTTADFLSGMIGSLPQVHELAKQAGIQLPGALGKVDGDGSVPAGDA